MGDFLASIAIFSFITAIFLFSWNGIVSNQAEKPSENMRVDARYTTTFLVSTEGYPEDWNSSTVEVPGFASSDNFLEEEKIVEFSEMDYKKQRILLNAENFYLGFRNETGGVVNSSYVSGKEPVNASTVTPVKRDVIINGSGGEVDAEMQYISWR